MKATQEQRDRFAQDWSQSTAILAAGVECDDCTDRAISATTNSERAHFHCADHFKAHMDRERAARPSRAELVARVNRAVGIETR